MRIMDQSSFILRLISLVPVLVYGTVAPEVYISAEQENVSVGESVSVSCHIYGEPEPERHWLKKPNGRTLVSSGHVRISGSLLVIDAVAPSDGGLYSCMAVSPSGNASKDFALHTQPGQPQDLSVTSGPTSVFFSIKTPPISGGTPITNFTLQWKQNSGHQWNETTVPASVHLAITSLKPYTYYKVRLAALNAVGLGQFSDTHFIGTQGIQAPEVYLSLEQQNVSVGENMSVSCNVSGRPQPELHWLDKHSGHTLNSSGHVRVMDGVLVIDAVAPSDGGLYSCMAVSPSGNASKDFALHTQPGQPQNLSVTSGPTSVFFSIKTPPISGGTPITNFTLQWQWSPAVPWNETTVPASVHLAITSLKPYTYYKVRLAALNAVGLGQFSDTHFIRTQSILTPSIYLSTEQENVTVGKSLFVSCHVYGEPQPEQHWLKKHNGRTLVSSGHVRIMGGLLVIDAVAPSDGGLYSCMAVSPSGNASKDFALHTQPGQPQDLSVTPGPSSVLFSIKTPPISGGTPITSFTLQWKRSSADQWNETTVPASVPLAITSLKPYTDYIVRLAALNAVGLGQFSDTHTIHTQDIQTGSTGLDEQMQDLLDKYENLLNQWNQLQISYNTLTEERNQLQTRHNHLTEERDHLRTRHNHLTEEIYQLRTRCNSLTEQGNPMTTPSTDMLQGLEELNRPPRPTFAECRQGWTKFNNSCYYVSTESSTWTRSRQDCKDRGADLVIINTKEEQTFVTKFNYRTWIGLSDLEREGTFKWVDGTDLVGNGFWQSGEPNDAGNEDCVEVSRGKGWNDMLCTGMLYWVCEE